MTKKIPAINHSLKDTFEALSLDKDSVDKKVKDILDAYNKGDDKSPSQLVQGLEDGLNSRELAYLTYKALDENVVYKNELIATRNAVNSLYQYVFPQPQPETVGTK